MPILCYHAVERDWDSPLAVVPAAFEAQMRWLRARRGGVVTLEQAVERLTPSGRLPGRAVAVTFDDGFSSVYEQAFVTLRALRLPATVFLVADTLSANGRTVDWVDDPPPTELRTLTREQVLEMHGAGVAFGSHSRSHRDLTTLSDDECERDLRESREILEELLRHDVRLLAYPRGRNDPRVWRAAERAGYTHAFSLPESSEATGRYAVPRVGVYRGNSLQVVRVKASRWYARVRASGAYPLARRLAGRGTMPARIPG